MWLGWPAICHHLSYRCRMHAGASITRDGRVGQDCALAAKADAVFHMAPEPYGGPRGAALEAAWAREMGTPVYTDLSILPVIEDFACETKGLQSL